jgi:hypothetical protein
MTNTVDPPQLKSIAQQTRYERRHEHVLSLSTAVDLKRKHASVEKFSAKEARLALLGIDRRSTLERVARIASFDFASGYCGLVASVCHAENLDAQGLIGIVRGTLGRLTASPTKVLRRPANPRQRTL